MQSYGELTAYFAWLPDWASYLIAIVLVTWTVCMMGFALAKAGRNPLWALLGFVTYLFLPMLWIIAYARWPREEQARAEAAETRGGD